VLGPLEVAVDGVSVDLSGKERALLALLAADANRVVAAESLIDDLWEGSPPESAVTSLRVHVSRLRKALSAAGADTLIHTRPPGYLLDVESEAVDARRFERLVEEARRCVGEGGDAAAADLLHEALALWRGPALAEVVGAPRVGPECTRLEELRLAAVEDRVDVDLRLGKDSAIVAELQALVKAHPLRERMWGQLMLALYRSGRQTEALRAFQELREKLAEAVGLEPSAELVQIEASILNQDQALDGPRGYRDVVTAPAE